MKKSLSKEKIMKDEKIIAIREKTFKELALAEDNFESAILLLESEKYRPSIPFFIDSVSGAVKALLRLDRDELPDDSELVDSFLQSETSREIKLDMGLDEIIEKLNNAKKDAIDHPLSLSKVSIKNLEECSKQIENFISKTRKLVKNSLLTTQEIKKKRIVRKLTVTISAGIVAVALLAIGIRLILISGHGLTGAYFADQNFEQLIKTRIDKKIDFNWDLENVIASRADSVYIRWTGKLKAPKNGLYNFIARADDGVRLWINDKLVIDDWAIHVARERAGKINLKEGYHKIKLEYFESDGFASIRLMWIIPETKEKKVIPPSYLRKS